jgi:hypothetical protein
MKHPSSLSWTENSRDVFAWRTWQPSLGEEVPAKPDQVRIASLKAFRALRRVSFCFYQPDKQANLPPLHVHLHRGDFIPKRLSSCPKIHQISLDIILDRSCCLPDSITAVSLPSNLRHINTAK